ncbi:hypothetical protein ATCCBAA256_07560 [Mycobacterium montefiorense]|nr:hypothetical protein ATCCBAA256_07560 [Mycobacterium montefiorense]
MHITQDRINDRPHQPQTINQVVGTHQGDRRRAIGQGKNTEMPTRPSLRIYRHRRTLISPITEFRAWTSALGEFDVDRFLS